MRTMKASEVFAHNDRPFRRFLILVEFIFLLKKERAYQVLLDVSTCFVIALHGATVVCAPK